VFFERDDVTAFDVGQGFIDARLGPSTIVALPGRVLSSISCRAPSSTEGKSPRATLAFSHASCSGERNGEIRQAR
jgi:hypothetical protein